VRDPKGRLEVAIRFTAAGPVLDLEAVGLIIRSDSEVMVDCQRFRVHARDRLSLESGGTLVERAAGDHRTEVGGHLEARARSVGIHAEQGSVDIEAAADARVVGDRLLFNC
jgi:hypothetical protein